MKQLGAKLEAAGAHNQSGSPMVGICIKLLQRKRLWKQNTDGAVVA